MPRKTNFTTSAKGKDGKKYKSSYYRTTATIGKNADGKPIRKQFYGDSKKDAEQMRDDYLAGLKQGLAVGYDKATFGKRKAEQLLQEAIRDYEQQEHQ